MSLEEFFRWQQRYRTHPFGDKRRDMQAGIIASVIVNALREKGGKRVGPSDFLLRFEERKQQTTLEAQALARAMTKRLGGLIVDHAKANDVAE
jgi:hypothetical protein